VCSQASGINDTGEQLGGAVGIALFALLAERGIHVTQGEMHQGREFVLRDEQKGLHQVSLPPRICDVLGDFEAAHMYASQLTFGLVGVVAIVGAVDCLLLFRKRDHPAPKRIFSRRSRWTWVTKAPSRSVAS
jgi:hypothetical protein